MLAAMKVWMEHGIDLREGFDKWRRRPAERADVGVPEWCSWSIGPSGSESASPH